MIAQLYLSSACVIVCLRVFFLFFSSGEQTYLQKYTEQRVEIDNMPEGPEKNQAFFACQEEHDEAVEHMLKFVPRMVLHVWDHDVIGSDDYIGNAI